MEQETLAFHSRVRRGYLTLAQAEPARWRVLDATQSVKALQAAMRAEVAAQLGLA